LNGTWTLIGDAEANDIRINPGAALNQFTVTGQNGTTVAGVTDASNVRNIVVRFGAGNDYLDVNSTNALARLRGNLKVFGGSGANYVLIDDFMMKNLTIINGGNTTGEDSLYLYDSTVQKNAFINNGVGNSSTGIYRNGGVSAIGGNLTIINGVGEDFTEINDTHIGGNVTVSNGLPDAGGDAGYFGIYNESNEMSRSIIGGNVFVSYQGGEVDYDGIWDTEILGNVKFKYGGSAKQELYFDGYSVLQPVHIHGNLTVIGQGDVRLEIGGQYEETGLIVGKNFTVRTGAGADSINIAQLSVGRATQISTGGSGDTIMIDNSSFAGPATIQTGDGGDSVLFETVDGTNFATQFTRALNVLMGGGDDTLTLGFAGDQTRLVEMLGTTRLLGGDGTDTLNRLNAVHGLDALIDTVFETINL
jgi:hypothetical protein